MKIRAFILSYIFFLGVLFTALAVMLLFTTNNQMQLLQNQGVREFQSIANSLARDISMIYRRSHDFDLALNDVITSYNRHYSQHGVTIEVTSGRTPQATMEFTEQNNEHFLMIQGSLPFHEILLHYSLNVTETFRSLDAIQNQLLIVAALFSVIAAIVLYFLFSYIFKPIKILAEGTRTIANGTFSKRIKFRSSNELASLISDFNMMADTIEKQFKILEGEAHAKQQFVDSFSHEIRTPLTAILGYAEYIQKADVPPAQLNELMGIIHNEATHMKNLGDLLLELATLRQYVPVKTFISVADLFQDIETMMEPMALEHETKLHFHYDYPTLFAQEDLIKSLFVNLIKNAIKATKNGTITVHFYEENNIKIFKLTDTGSGIPADILPKITEPFVRIDKARSRQEGGTGLGLAIAKQIVDIHGAKMDIESTVGIGTTITIRFGLGAGIWNFMKKLN